MNNGDLFYFCFLGVNSQLSAGFACTAQTHGGKKTEEEQRNFALVKPSVAIAGSLQRIAPPSCPAEPPNQALGANQTSPCQQKHKGSPVGCGIWDFSRPAWLQVLPGQTHRLPHFPCWQQAYPMEFHGGEMLLFVASFHVYSRRHSEHCFTLLWILFLFSGLYPGTALVTLVLLVATSLVISSTQSC